MFKSECLSTATVGCALKGTGKHFDVSGGSISGLHTVAEITLGNVNKSGGKSKIGHMYTLTFKTNYHFSLASHDKLVTL